jgi:hypothetical protein
MSGLNRMIQRVKYEGYNKADDRNVTGKYKSFKAALGNSYQAEWITLNRGSDNESRWRCLINPSRLTEEFDKKVLSIDFDSGVQEGTVFWWDRTNKYWIVNLQQHTEEAYFRGTISRCDYEIDIDGTPYWISLTGPKETDTVWNEKHGIAWNDLNYSMKGIITKNNQTVNYFSRHNVIKLKLTYPDIETGETIEEWHRWKVVATDKYSSNNVIEVYLKEWYDNEAEDAMIQPEAEEPDLMQPHIEGPASCHVFDTNLSFSVVGLNNGKFVVNSNKVKIKEMTETSCLIDILASKSMTFKISYVVDGENKADLSVVVKSF